MAIQNYPPPAPNPAHPTSHHHRDSQVNPGLRANMPSSGPVCSTVVKFRRKHASSRQAPPSHSRRLTAGVSASSVRDKFDRHKTTARCALSSFKDRNTEFHIEGSEKVCSEVGRYHRERGAPKSYLNFFILFTPYLTVSMTDNHQVSGSSTGKAGIDLLPAPCILRHLSYQAFNQ